MRHAQVKNIPIRLNSWEPGPARLYAWREMALRKQGVSKREARETVQVQYEAEAARRCVIPPSCLLDGLAGVCVL